jgi:hypothetical protein
MKPSRLFHAIVVFGHAMTSPGAVAAAVAATALPLAAGCGEQRSWTLIDQGTVDLSAQDMRWWALVDQGVSPPDLIEPDGGGDGGVVD